ncbi:MAG TPA: O-antigen ligase family protein [Acidimicrobiales bacterium]
MTWASRWAAVLVLAVAAAMDPWGLRPFTTVRWAIVGVAAAAAAASTRWRVPKRLLAAWLALLGLLALATVLALDPLIALLGHPRRHLGLLGWLVSALAFAAGTGIPAEGVRRVVARAGVVAGLVTGASVLADLAGWDPAGTSFAGGRAGGLLGQPAYLGAVAVLLGPLALGVALDAEQGRRWQAAAWVAAAGAALAALASQTRGAWVGLAVAAVVAWPWLRQAMSRSWLRRAAGAHRAAVAAAGAVVLVGLVVVGPVGTRGADLLDPGQAGGRGRVDEWALAAHVIADRPALGAGPEGYRIAAPAHIDPGYARRHGRDEVVDRAHDGPLDLAAAAGIPAALLYAGLLAAVAIACGRVVRRAPDPVAAGAAVGVVAWIVQQLVGFPIAEVDPLAWLLAGAVLVVAGSGAAAAPGAERWWEKVGRALAAVLAVALVPLGVTAVMADRSLEQAVDGADTAAADRATRLRPDDIDAWYVAAQVAASGPSLLAVDAGLDRVEAGRGHSPHDPALADLEEGLLAERALRSGLDEDLAAAEAAARARIAADPAGPDHYRRLAQVLEAEGRTAEAAEAGARARDLDPDAVGAG